MAGIQLSGLASGLDTKSLIDQMMQLNSVPVTNLQKEQSTITTQTQALNGLSEKLQALQTSADALNAANTFTQRTATTTNNLWTVTAAPGATAMTHTIAVTALASAAKLQGRSNISGVIRADGDTSQVLISGMNVAQKITAGQFTVNGAKVSIATTDTLAEAFQKISDATGGTVTASYDASTDSVSLNGSTGAITLGSANDTSNFLQALKLNNNGTGSVTSSSRLGSANLDTPLSSAGLNGTMTVDGTNAGKMMVNGVEIDYNAGTDSLRTLISKINASTAGVTASYDAQNDRMVLTNNVTGDLGVTVQDGTGNNLASLLGLDSSSTLVHGGNAQFSVDGGPTRTSATNNLDENALGVTGLSVTISSKTTENVTVGNDTSAARKLVEDFIAKYNDATSFIDQQTSITTTGSKVTTGTLFGNDAATEASRNLRSAVFRAFGGTGSVQRLQDMGIDFDGTNNQLKIKDSSKLDSVLASNSADVSKFFSDSGAGFSKRLDSVLGNQTGPSGSIATAVASNNKRSASITSQIADMQRHLDQQRAALEAEFTQMEQMQSTLQNQMAQLNSAFGGSNTTSSSSSKNSN